MVLWRARRSTAAVHGDSTATDPTQTSTDDPATDPSGEVFTGRPVPDPRGMLRLLADPVFGPFWFGKLVSTTGVWIHNIMAAILVLELTHSPFAVGLVTAAQFIPQFFAPVSGAWADRGDVGRQLILGRVIAGTGSGALALWLALVGVDGMPGAWPVIAIGFYVGIGFVIGSPAMQAMIPTMVRPGELPTAIALNTVPFTAARAAGPALGALVAVSAGPAAAFAIAAAANLLFALVIVLLRFPRRDPATRPADPSIRAGLAVVRRDRTLLLLLFGITAVGFGGDPAITLTPPLSQDFGAGATLVGWFASAFGIGAAAAVLIMRAMRRIPLPVLATTGLWFLGAGGIAVALSPDPATATVMFALSGVGLTLSVTAISTLLQERVADEVRGRIMALWLVAFVGSRPLAAALDGALADLLNTRAALAIVGALVVGVALVCRPARLAGVRDRSVVEPVSATGGPIG